MPRDYASRQKCMKMSTSRCGRGRRRRRKNRRGLWLTTFLLIFLFAGSLNYLKNHTANTTSQTTVAQTPKPTKIIPQKKAKPKTQTAATPKFDFYDLLPKQKVGTKSNTQVGDEYWLGIKNTSSVAQADHMKAELSLLGFDVAVKKSSSGYKVMTGPYATRDAAKYELKRLQENHLSGKLLKSHS